MTDPPSLSPGRNTEGWAKDLKENDFRLLCPDGKRKPVGDANNCFLAKAPNHAVVSRKDKASCVRQTLLELQVRTSQGLPFFPPGWVWMIWGSSVLSAAHTQAFPFWKLGSGGQWIVELDFLGPALLITPGHWRLVPM